MIMPPLHRLSSLVFVVTIAALGCLAQTPAPAAQSSPLSLEMRRRIEVQIRERASLPPEATVHVRERMLPSDLPGFNTIAVTIIAAGQTSKPINFLLSADGKTLAQFTKFDLTGDPKEMINTAGWPSRGGPANAPVQIVSFDDLECPFCARMHAQLYAGIESRYSDEVRLVYMPMPSDEHPWAMRAAVDVSCMLPESASGYWNLVDYFHEHAGEMGMPVSEVPTPGAPQTRSMKLALDQVDKQTREQAESQKLDMTKVNACIAKQDTAAIVASEKIGVKLNVERTPVLFINGAKVEGAVSMNFIYGVIDDALLAQGITPPRPYISPAPATSKP